MSSSERGQLLSIANYLKNVSSDKGSFSVVLTQILYRHEEDVVPGINLDHREPFIALFVGGGVALAAFGRTKHIQNQNL